MDQEHSRLKMFVESLIPALDLLWERVYQMLRQHYEFAVQERSLEQDIAHAILFAQLPLIGRVGLMILSHPIKKTVHPWVCSGNERSRIEFETIALLVRRCR